MQVRTRKKPKLHFLVGLMLFTDSSWEELHPFKRAVLQPLLGWRCIGWSDHTLNFFVVASPGREDLFAPDGWVVDGAEALIELVSHLDDVGFSVYLMARKDADASITLCRVCALWKEVEAKGSDASGYWYSTADGPARPCSPLRSALHAKEPRLMKLLSFEDS